MRHESLRQPPPPSTHTHTHHTLTQTPTPTPTPTQSIQCYIYSLLMRTLCIVFSLNYINVNLWNVITHQCPKFNGSIITPSFWLGYGWVITDFFIVVAYSIVGLYPFIFNNTELYISNFCCFVYMMKNIHVKPVRLKCKLQNWNQYSQLFQQTSLDIDRPVFNNKKAFNREGPEQNGRYYEDDILNFNFVKGNWFHYGLKSRVLLTMSQHWFR